MKPRRTTSWVLIAVPVCLLILQSYLRDASFLGAIFVSSSWPYWTLRLLLVSAFLLLLRAPFPMSPPTQPDPRAVPTVDKYEAERRSRDPLLALRFLAFLNVFMGHWFLVVFSAARPAETPLGALARTLLGMSPWYGVWTFFTLSGYLMAKGFASGRHALTRDGVLNFYRNRALRILPIYLSAILIVMALQRPDLLNLGSGSARLQLLEALTFDQHASGAIGALWLISTEFQFYLVVPFMYLAIRGVVRRKILVATGTVCMLVLFAFAKWKLLSFSPTPEMWWDRVYFPLVSNLDCFIAGMAAAILVQTARERGFYLRGGLYLALIVVGTSQIAFSIWSNQEMASYPGYPGSDSRPLFLAAAPGISAFVTAVTIVLSEISVRAPGGFQMPWKFARIGGSMTFVLYVWHEPVQVTLRRLLPEQIDTKDALIWFPLGAAVSFGIAWIFYTSIETHFDAMRRMHSSAAAIDHDDAKMMLHAEANGRRANRHSVRR